MAAEQSTDTLEKGCCGLFPEDAPGNLGEEFLAAYEFGGPVAHQTGALIEEDRDALKAARPLPEEGSRVADGSQDYRGKLAEMDFDQRLAATLECLGRRSTFRDILYGLLGFCLQERSYEEIEPFVRDFTEFHRNRQSERRYVCLLLRTGALEEIELGEDGQPLTQEAKQTALDEGLEPEDLDTLVYDWRVATTDVGRAAYEQFSPNARLLQLFAQEPDCREGLLRVMAFCAEPRTMGAIDDKFRGTDFMGFDEANRMPRQPSAFIDRLDRAGAVAWNGNFWMLTEDGRAFLDALEVGE